MCLNKQTDKRKSAQARFPNFHDHNSTTLLVTTYLTTYLVQGPTSNHLTLKTLQIFLRQLLSSIKPSYSIIRMSVHTWLHHEFNTNRKAGPKNTIMTITYRQSLHKVSLQDMPIDPPLNKYYNQNSLSPGLFQNMRFIGSMQVQSSTQLLHKSGIKE